MSGPVNVDGIIIDTTVLDRITANMKPKAAGIVETYGQAIAGESAQNAPYETGALMNSLLSESKMTGELTFTIQDGTTYGIFQELGTSIMAAQPFLIPAVEAWRQRFLDAFGGLFK